jgi:hypothetical protein
VKNETCNLSLFHDWFDVDLLAAGEMRTEQHLNLTSDQRRFSNIDCLAPSNEQSGEHSDS